MGSTTSMVTPVSAWRGCRLSGNNGAGGSHAAESGKMSLKLGLCKDQDIASIHSTLE